LFAKSDDDVGPLRAMRERQDQTNCRDVTIRRPKIYAVPVQPFFRPREIVQVCLRSWRLVRGRRRRVS
jgi:hypothetical protein